MTLLIGDRSRTPWGMALVLFYTILLGYPHLLLAQGELGPRKNLFRIDKIKIKGTKKVEDEAILEKIGSREGMVLDNYLLRKDILKIYKMKFFESVEARKEIRGGKKHLVFVVKERPIISEIEFEGNDDLSSDDLLEKVETKKFNILDISTIKIDVTSIQKFYEEKGYYLASIDYDITPVSDENVKLTFKITEYDKVKVKKITFLGNVAFSDNELKSIMETREESVLSFMSDAGNFKEFNFQTDIERIKYFYKSKGHLQVNIGNPVVTVSEDRKWVFISVKITEGPKFTINDLFFTGDLIFSEDDFLEKIEINKEETYSEDKLRKDIQKLAEMYQDEGYAFCQCFENIRNCSGGK